MPGEVQIVPWHCHLCGNDFSEERGGRCRSCSRATCEDCWGDRAAFLPRVRCNGNAKSALPKSKTMWNASLAGPRRNRSRRERSIQVQVGCRVEDESRDFVRS